jgi:hypothetical protein
MEDVFRAPWGNCVGIASTLTTDKFPIDHLGNEVGRTEKIRWLAEHRPHLIPYISVCHRDKSIGGNCGKCEKCARTRIALAVIPDPQRRTEAELSLFGNTSEDHRDFFRLSAGEHKSTARLFDLSIALPDGEVRQRVNDAIDKVIAEQQRLQKITKPKRTRAQRVRSWAGRLKRKISKQAHGEQAS